MAADVSRALYTLISASGQPAMHEECVDTRRELARSMSSACSTTWRGGNFSPSTRRSRPDLTAAADSCAKR